MKHPFYPFPLSLLPAAALLALNLAQLSAGRIIHPALAMLALSLGLMAWGRYVVFKDWDRAAWGACVILAIFNWQVLLWPCLLGLAILLLWKGSIGHKNIILNALALALLAAALVYIGVRAFQRGELDLRLSTVNKSQRSKVEGPDVLFIILDSYTGHDVLMKRFGYDDTPFLTELQALGFQTGQCTSLAATTEKSLVREWNGSAPADAWALWRAYQHNRVRTTLEAQGYQTVAFEDGFDWSEWRDASMFYYAPLLLNDFDWYYLMQSLPGKIPPLSRAILAGWSQDYRTRALSALVNLPKAARLASPHFIYFHLLLPHPPFVFNADGTPAAGYALRSGSFDAKDDSTTEYDPATYSAGYIGQIGYLASILPGVLRAFFAASVRDPLVIIQGDHGAWYAEGEDQYSVLCAVHNPAGLSVPLETGKMWEFVQ